MGTNVITSEYSSRKWRSFAISVYAAGFGIGAVLGGMFAVMLQGEYGWRSVFLAGAILTGLLLVVLFIWLPESIDFLTSKQPKNACDLNLIIKKIGLAGDWETSCKSRKKLKVKLPVPIIQRKNNTFYPVNLDGFSLQSCSASILSAHGLSLIKKRA